MLGNIKFIKSCKTANVKVMFLTVKLSQKNRNYKLKLQIEQLVMETGIQNKHLEKRKTKKDIKLHHSLSLILYNNLMHQINKAVNWRIKSIS